MILGLDIGGTNTKFGVFDSNFNIVATDSIATSISSNYDFFDNLRKLKYSLYDTYDIQAIGIALPGVVSSAGRVIVSPNLPFLNGLDFIEELNIGKSIPIILENDANSAAYGELMNTNIANFIFVTLGTGIGGGIVINNQLYRGTSGSAGEIGHLIINSHLEYGDNVDYRTGTLESLTGADAIIKIAKDLASKDPQSKLNSYKVFDTKTIAELANAGDNSAITALQITGTYLGIGFAAVANLLDISTFILGGGISAAGEHLYNSITNAFKSRSLKHNADNFKLIISELGNTAGVIGVAHLAKNNLSTTI
jgi:glucokinase